MTEDGEKRRGIEMRDAYHDFVTDNELADCRSLAQAQQMVADRRARLMHASGARNVNSAVMRYKDEPWSMTRQMAVSFDSRAWTGR